MMLDNWISIGVTAAIAGYLVWRKFLHPLFELRGKVSQIACGEYPLIAGDPSMPWQETWRQIEAISIRLRDLKSHFEEDERNLHAILQSMAEGVVIVDEHQRILLFNPSFEKMFRLRDDPTGKTVLEATLDASVEGLVRDAIQSGKECQRKLILHSADVGGAGLCHVEAGAIPIRERSRWSGAMVLVFHDITRIEDLEGKRREWIASISHELRTPLAIFRGYLETLAATPEMESAERSRVYGAMQRQSNRLERIVNDLLVLSRIESGRLELMRSTIPLKCFLEKIIRDYGFREESKGAHIDLSVEGNVILSADELRLEQVLLNLLDNAVAYSEPPAQIRVSAGSDHQEVWVEIGDRGSGILPADLPRIFEKFYRADKSRARKSGGSGLGLAIVKEIVELHGGTVLVESEVGKGTVVRLRFVTKL